MGVERPGIARLTHFAAYPTITNAIGSPRSCAAARHERRSMDDGLGCFWGWECHSPTQSIVWFDSFQRLNATL